jgi:RNA polymerase sigma factor (sigma-70 family)
MADQLVAELQVLRQQLTTLGASAEVRAARQLTADVLPVLEPVWNMLVDQDNGVGFLRRLGTTNEPVINADVTVDAVRTFRSLELVGSGTGAVWQALSRPSTALVESVRKPLRRNRPANDGPARATLGPSVRPVLPQSLLDEWDRECQVVPALRRVLRRWCDIARNSTGERREVARLTLAAAMLARGAVLDGDTATVKWFVKRWLGLGVTESRVDGTSAALLENDWHHRTVDDEFSTVRDSVTDLRVEALYQHRVHRPVWETQLRGASVTLLGDQILPYAADDDPMEAATKNLLAEQMRSVLATLSEREASIARLLFMEGRPLAEAAAFHGVTPYRVKQVRDKTMRKLRHPSRSQVLEGYQWD